MLEALIHSIKHNFDVCQGRWSTAYIGCIGRSVYEYSKFKFKTYPLPTLCDIHKSYPQVT